MREVVKLDDRDCFCGADDLSAGGRTLAGESGGELPVCRAYHIFSAVFVSGIGDLGVWRRANAAALKAKWRELALEVVLGVTLGVGVFMALLALIWMFGV